MNPRTVVSRAGLAAVLVAACDGSAGGDSRGFVGRAPQVAALAALPDGGLVFGERLTGRIMQADADGRVRPAPVGKIAVSVNGQRGLLGLAVDPTERIFAAWTEPGGRILVGQIAPGARRLVWEGPLSADLANGGHLAFDRNGGLLVAVGDLLDQPRINDPTYPNGKFLRLDANGPPTQQPRVVSSGWNNPFAFTVDREGRVWVADNTPGQTPERLARADAGLQATDVVVLPPGSAPSGLAASGRILAVCSYLTGALLAYRTAPTGPPAPLPDGTLADDCRLGVVSLSDGRLVYSTGRGLRVLPAPVDR